jgi:hypothetical protein
MQNATAAEFRTTAAYISGAICGDMWWPNGALGGKLVKKNLRGPWGIMGKDSERITFAEAIDGLLTSEGGDFQNPQLTNDTVIRIERRRMDGNYKYTIHVKEIQVSSVAPDYVNEDAYVSDFMGEDD